MKMKFSKILTLMIAWSISLLTFSQQQELPIDAKVRYGKLSNGLTYYIRANKEPKERAEFFIAQNVGSILENDDQNGLAHFLEHMAFNGTKNFPGKNLINYFESIGVKFGENINAYTSLDETVYNLSAVPTTREGIIDSALLALHDWSGFIALDEKEIDAERGVIREEWRTGANAERRMWKESNRLKYPNSQYAKRDVIGDTAIINNFNYSVLRNFYKKWYRPDLQAVIIVGDINVDKIEEKIKRIFDDIPKSQNEGERPIYPILDNEKPIISIVKDTEAKMTRLELEYKSDIVPTEIKKSISGYVINIINNLISTMIGYRFDEITQQANAPFVGGYGGYGALVKSKDAFQLMAVPKEGKELEGLSALFLEAEKIKRFGFTNSELDRAKTDMLKGIETMYNERENQKNESYVNEYVNHFLTSEPIPGIEWEYNTLQLLLPQLQLASINKIAQAYVRDSNLIISISGPDKESVSIPTELEILTTLKQTSISELKAPKEEVNNKPLITKHPKPGTVVKSNKNQKLGSTEWILNNGVRVVFKPTTFKKDEILMTAFSMGGLSKVQNKADLPSALLAASIVTNNGLGDFSSIELNKILTGKIANVTPSIDSYEEGFSGSSSVVDFETMMQLLYLHFTAPRLDNNAFTAMMNGYKTALANGGTDPKRAFSDSIKMTMSGHHARTTLFNLNTIEKVNQEKALKIYKERFASPSDFTFIFTGNIDPENENTKKIICEYLGGLKTKKQNEQFTDNNIRIPKGKIINEFDKDMKVKTASNFIVYSANMEYSLSNIINMTAIGDILSMRYLESIREKEGGSYGVGVRGNVTNTPVNEATLLMKFDTDPLKQEKLLSIIHAEVNTIVTNGPKVEDVQKVKENLLKSYSEYLNDNNWWQSALTMYYQDKIDFVNNYTNAVNNLTPESIKNTLMQLTAQGNVIEITMKPKK